jgi:hypothetical protein
MPGGDRSGVYKNREGPVMIRIVPWHYENKMNVLLIFEQLYAGASIKGGPAPSSMQVPLARKCLCLIHFPHCIKDAFK